VTLGDCVAEEIFFSTENITTGAQADLQKITGMAFGVCGDYGMNETIGPVGYGSREGEMECWTKPFSEKAGGRLMLRSAR